MKSRICASAVLMFLCISTAAAESGKKQPSYYIYRGGQTSAVYNRDPARIEPDMWQVRLYTRGSSPTQDSRWGSISDDSAGAVMQELKRRQDWERKHAELFTDDITYLNPVGPIALFVRSDSEKPTARNALDKVRSYAERIREVQKIEGDLNAILDRRSADSDPFKNVGAMTREYTENLAGAYQQLARLGRSMHQWTYVLSEDIAASADISKLEQSAQKLRGAMDAELITGALDSKSYSATLAGAGGSTTACRSSFAIQGQSLGMDLSGSHKFGTSQQSFVIPLSTLDPASVSVEPARGVWRVAFSSRTGETIVGRISGVDEDGTRSAPEWEGTQAWFYCSSEETAQDLAQELRARIELATR